MTETIIVALITGGLALFGTLGGSYLANRKSAALIAYRLEQLEQRSRPTITLSSGPISWRNGQNSKRKKSRLQTTALTIWRAFTSPLERRTQHEYYPHH